MNVGSLFSGIGGIELGFEAEGFNTLWYVEYEPYAQAVLRKRFPDATIYGDITQLNFASLPKVDILTGGFPCQDISNAGKRAGITGSRSSLWKYYLEAIRVLRPKYALIENVSAILGRGLDVVLADLASVGYDAEWHCVPASSIGANHQRNRLFIMAYAISYGRGRAGFQFEERCNSNEVNTIITENTNVPNHNSERFKEQRKQESNGEEQFSTELFGGWSVEPDVGRVVNGIPNRVDRIKCLGNAVVPQVAQVFAQALKAEPSSKDIPKSTDINRIGRKVTQ